MKAWLKKYLPVFILQTLKRFGLYRSYKPAPGRIQRGDLHLLTPFSNQFGYDRGGPIDRYYIENFLEQHSPDIKGRVLEIGDDLYTKQYGKGRVLRTDVLHVDADHPGATIVGDLSNAPQIESDCFDCIILTQTLHLIFDYAAAVQTCYRILKPGGTLLLTSPGITPIDHGEWNKNWFWSFTEQSLTKILTAVFPANLISVETFGNVLAATSFLYGLGLPEMKKEQLDFRDPHYPVIVAAKATKLFR